MGRLFDDATPEQEQAYIEEQRRINYLVACRWPLSWLLHARRHKRAADILFDIAYEAYEREMKRDLAEAKEAFARSKKGLPNVSVSRVLEGQELLDHRNMELLEDYYLLAGYAMECILKGYLLASRPELVKDDKRIGKLILTHDLCKLCHECAIDLSLEEQNLLNLISRYTDWGKYPAPIEIKDMPCWVDSEDDKKKSFNVGNPFQQRLVQLLFNRVFQRGLDLLNSLSNSQPKDILANR